MSQGFSKRMLKKVQKAGLPEPDQGTTPAQFAKLQKQWYAKLRDDGFEDIEWVDHSTGRGHDSGYLKGSLVAGKAFHPGRDLYYQLASNYLQHCYGLRKKPYERLIWKLHSEGKTYDEVLQVVTSKYKNPPSKFTLYYQLKHLAKLCYRWNAQNPEGLLVKRKEDKQLQEESALAEFYNIEYNWLCNEQFAAQEKMFAKQKRRK